MEHILKKMMNPSLEIESSEFLQLLNEVSNKLGVYQSEYDPKPYVSYSLYWLTEKEAKENRDLNKADIFKPTTKKIEERNIGEPIYTNSEIREYFRLYKKDGYNDLISMKSQLLKEIQINNKGIYEFIRYIILKSIKGNKYSIDELVTTEENLLELCEFLFTWALGVMFKFNNETAPPYFKGWIEQLITLRHQGAEAQLRVNLINYLLYSKRYKTIQDDEDFLTQLGEKSKAEQLKQTIERKDIIRKAHSLKRDGMKVNDMFDFISNWLFNELHFSPEEIKIRFNFELTSPDSFNRFVNKYPTYNN